MTDIEAVAKVLWERQVTSESHVAWMVGHWPIERVHAALVTMKKRGQAHDCRRGNWMATRSTQSAK